MLIVVNIGSLLKHYSVSRPSKILKTTSTKLTTLKAGRTATLQVGARRQTNGVFSAKLPSE
ncbi:MAG: hypothetical protein DCE89_05895, partial [Betaproteobacteria bacterium]